MAFWPLALLPLQVHDCFHDIEGGVGGRPVEGEGRAEADRVRARAQEEQAALERFVHDEVAQVVVGFAALFALDDFDYHTWPIARVEPFLQASTDMVFAASRLTWYTSHLRRHIAAGIRETQLHNKGNHKEKS